MDDLGKYVGYGVAIVLAVLVAIVVGLCLIIGV